MRQVVLCLLCSFSIITNGQLHHNATAGGTSIVIFQRPDSIWMASDSKMSLTFETGHNAITPPTANRCKIVCARNIAAASTSDFAINYKDDTLRYDASIEMRKAIAQSKDVSDAIGLFSKATIKYLNQLIREIKKENQQRFDTLVKKEDLMETFFSTVVSGKSYSAVLSFKLIGRAQKWRIDTAISLKRGISTLLMIGTYDSIYKYLQLDTRFLTKNISPEKKLTFLIGLEMVAKPESVGPPIDIIVLYKDGHKWLHFK